MNSPATRWLFSGLYVLAYLALDWVSYAQPVLKLGVSPWSPQTGLMVAYLLWLGPRWVPVAVVAEFTAAWLFRDASSQWAPHALASVWVAGTYAGFAALGGAGLMQRALQTLGSAMRMLLATAVAALVSAAGYVGSFMLLDELALSAASNGLVRYWIGQVNGVVMLVPLLMLLPLLPVARRALRDDWWRAALQALVLGLCIWVLFRHLEVGLKERMFYPLFVPMVWIAMRWGGVGALLASLVIQSGIVAMVRGTPEGAPPLDLQLLILTLSITGTLLGVAVTERARARAEARERDRQLARAMRFAVAGEMASALTHELNQPITALVSYLQASQIMSAPSVGADQRLSDTLAKAAGEARRASQVLRRLRDFYQGTSEAPAGPSDIAAGCASVFEVLDARLRQRGIPVRVSLAHGLPPVAIDGTRLEIVLHNVFNNAVDALVGSGASRSEVLVTAHQDGPQVVINIHDSGPGVAEEALGQLFEPFYTTKPDGMGLGLAICQSLVRAQGGELTYRRSELLGGACFELRLPVFK